MGTTLWFVLAQTEAPSPLLPETNEVVWSSIAVLLPILAVMAVVAWILWRCAQATRRTADQAPEAMNELRSEPSARNV
jgi:uncharacterized membrane protein AbrB (regulator of aidB expression)